MLLYLNYRDQPAHMSQSCKKDVLWSVEDGSFGNYN